MGCQTVAKGPGRVEKTSPISFQPREWHLRNSESRRFCPPDFSQQLDRQSHRGAPAYIRLAAQRETSKYRRVRHFRERLRTQCVPGIRILREKRDESPTPSWTVRRARFGACRRCQTSPLRRGCDGFAGFWAFALSLSGPSGDTAASIGLLSAAFWRVSQCRSTPSWGVHSFWSRVASYTGWGTQSSWRHRQGLAL